MVALPDGTFLILNGALHGVAGFGLAHGPNLGALLYDPDKPVNQRISILNSTIVARLYHSEVRRVCWPAKIRTLIFATQAILLPDGRVLVSGSDPQDKINPEEFRIEVSTDSGKGPLDTNMSFIGLLSPVPHSRIYSTRIHPPDEGLGIWQHTYDPCHFTPGNHIDDEGFSSCRSDLIVHQHRHLFTV
jgi:hypothetical protein